MNNDSKRKRAAVEQRGSGVLNLVSQKNQLHKKKLKKKLRMGR